MKRSSATILGLFLMIITIGLFVYLLFYFVKPSQSEVDAQTKKIAPVNLSVLKTDMQTQTSGLEVNGQIPVTVSNDELGRDDPFASY